MSQKTDLSEPPTTAMPAAVEQSTAGVGVLVVILAAVFMVAAEARVISPLLPAIATDFETSITRAGYLISAYAIPYGLFQLVYGPLADRFPRQRVMGVALALFALGTLVSGFAPTLQTLDLLRLATGAAAAGVIPVALAYVGDAVPYAQRQAALGRVVSVASFGGVMSAALGGLIASFLSWRALFVAYGVVAGLVAVWMLLTPVRRARTKGATRRGILGPYVELFRFAGRRALALYGLVFVEGAVATSTIGFFGAFLFERDGFSYAVIGGLLMINGIASMITGQLVGRLVLRFSERSMVLLGGLLMAAAYLLAGLQPVLLFFPLAMLLTGSGFVIAHSTLQTRATELAPTQRGTAVAMFAFSLFLGTGLGTFVAGLAIDKLGYAATLAGTAVACVAFACLGAWLIKVVQKG